MHARNCDSLELCHKLGHADVIETILQNHPSWKRMYSNRLVGSREAKSERDWTGRLEVTAINITTAWSW